MQTNSYNRYGTCNAAQISQTYEWLAEVYEAMKKPEIAKSYQHESQIILFQD